MLLVKQAPHFRLDYISYLCYVKFKTLYEVIKGSIAT